MTYQERVRMADIIEVLLFALKNSLLTPEQMEVPVRLLYELSGYVHPKAKTA